MMTDKEAQEYKACREKMESFKNCLCPTCGQKLITHAQLVEASFGDVLKDEILKLVEKLRGD